MPLVPQVFQARQNVVQLVEAVGQHDDDAAAGDAFGEVVEDRGKTGAFLVRPLVEQVDQQLHVRRRAGRPDEAAHGVIIDDQAAGVLLMQRQVRQGGGGHGGVVVLADERHPIAAADAGAVAHGLAGVHQHPEGQVGFFLVLLEVEAAGAAVDLPVEVLEVVAGDVLAVLGELDGEAVIWALVHAGEIALDDEAGLQLQAAHLGEGERIEVALRVVGFFVDLGHTCVLIFGLRPSAWRARSRKRHPTWRRPPPAPPSRPCRAPALLRSDRAG